MIMPNVPLKNDLELQNCIPVNAFGFSWEQADVPRQYCRAIALIVEPRVDPFLYN